MPRTGSNIYKRQDGRWEGRYPKGRSDNGKIIYGYVYAKTCAEVKRRLNAASRENRQSPPKTTSAMCLAEIAEQWLSVTALTVKASTLDGYDATVKLHILPAFGASDIKALNTATISAFAQNKMQNGLLDGCGGLAPKTVRDILCVLKGIIDFAVREKYIDDPVSITYPKQQQKSMRVLSLSEQSALQKILLENPTIYKVGILLCLYTGLRVGEVCGLCWDDFSPGLDKLSVRRSVRRIKSKDGEKKK